MYKFQYTYSVFENPLIMFFFFFYVFGVTDFMYMRDCFLEYIYASKICRLKLYTDVHNELEIIKMFPRYLMFGYLNHCHKIEYHRS